MTLQRSKSDPETTQTYDVVGMSCAHCVSSVRSELEQIPGVRGVDVDLSTGTVTVHSDGPLDEHLVMAAVHEAGYEVAR